MYARKTKLGIETAKRRQVEEKVKKFTQRRNNKVMDRIRGSSFIV